MVAGGIKGSVAPVIPNFQDRSLTQTFQSISNALQIINASPIVFGVAVPVSIGSSGSITVKHGLGRVPIGYFPIQQTSGTAGFPTKASVQPSPFTTLVLTYAGAWAGSLWVF